MNEKTRKIFNGPWTADRATRELAFVVKDGSGKEIVKSSSPDTVKRIALLPDLYENLVEAAYEFCHNCLSLTSESEIVPDSDEFIEKNCPKKSKRCFVRTWWNTLKQVRGEKKCAK